MTGRRLGKGSRLLLAAATLLVAVSFGFVTGDAALAQGPTSVWDGVFTEEQAERGKGEYQQECAPCHLDDLLGDGIAPALIGAPFSFRWRDLSVGDIYVAIRTTMPQGAPASLSARAYVDIIAYLLQANEHPVGDTELPTDTEGLEAIIVDEKS